MKKNLATKYNDVKDNQPLRYFKWYFKRRIDKINDQKQQVNYDGQVTCDHYCTYDPWQLDDSCIIFISLALLINKPENYIHDKKDITNGGKF